MIAQWPGVPAWPITAPMDWLTKVTEVGWKFRGTWIPEPCGDRNDVAGSTLMPEKGFGLWIRRLGVGGRGGDDGPPTATGRPGPLWLCTGVEAILGTATAAATTITMPAVDITARPAFRRRARCLIRSNVPGGGARGSTSACSQASSRSRSRGLPIAVPQRRFQARPRVVQVRLDGAFRAAEHGGDLADAEPGVVVQQERAAQPRGQTFDQRAHVHVLRRVVGRVGRGGRGQAPDR